MMDSDIRAMERFNRRRRLVRLAARMRNRTIGDEMNSLKRRAMAMLLGLALLGGGLIAMPGRALAAIDPCQLVGRPCGTFVNHTNLYIYMTYEDPARKNGWSSPFTTWGGTQDRDMEYFWVPPNCTFWDDVLLRPFFGGTTGATYRGLLEGGGTQDINRAICTDAAHLNSNASVTGVEGKPSHLGCPSANFCLYTEANYKGAVYRLYRCGTYSLHSWKGVGSWINNNTGGAHGKILGNSANVLVDSNPATNNRSASYNFYPAWYVRAC